MENRRVASSKYRLTVEPVLFSFVFTGALSDGVITNLLLRQACWFEEGLPLDKCKGHYETVAQQKASYIEVFKMLIETVLPAILSLFIGPWSDTNGRKIIFVVPIIGHVITYSTWALLSLIKDLNPAYLLFSSLGVLCSGGFVTLYIGGFCYLADVTNEQNRVLRMGIAEASINIGQLSGFFLSPYVFKSIENGYWIVFVTNAVILALNSIYILIFLPETIKVPYDERKNLFRLDHLKDTYKTVMAPRQSHGRPIIFLSCFISILSLFIVFGESNVKYLSVIKEFGWELQDFTTYNAISLSTLFVASSVGIWLGGTIFKIGDDILLMFSIVLRILSGIFMGISKTTQFFYFGTLLSSFRSFTGPLVRSQLSKIAPQQDIGKVFSFLSSVEALAPQLAVPIYCTIYAAVVGFYPLSIYFVSAAISIIAAIIVGTIMVLKKISPPSSMTE